MNMKTIAAAALAVCSASAFAAVTPSCPATVTTANDLVTKCAPDITFYGAGATAMKSAIQTVLTTDGKIFNKSKPFASITVSGNSDQYAYYGYGAAGTTVADKKVLVIVNGKNGSTAGVIQLLTKLKSGSVEATVDQKEYAGVMQLHTATEEKAGTSMPAGAVSSVSDTAASTATVVLASTRVADFKTAWGKDKQKVAHMAFSDVRPSEATPGQVAKWAPAAFPSETIAMQGFGVVVNNNLYSALMARDVAAGRLPATCVADFTPACQPTIFAADYVGLMTGKITTANALLGVSGDTKTIKLMRRPASSGTQASTQIMFAGQAAYNAKLVDKASGKSTDGSLNEMLVGGDTTAPVVSGDLTVTTFSGTGSLIAAVQAETANYALGVASLDNAASAKFGSPQTARWVKVNGFSPDADATGAAFDGKQRTGLQAGYPFAMEFQVLKDAKLAGDYLTIYNLIKSGLKDPAANLTGIAYIGSSDTAKNTTWTRGENNYLPLNKY